MKLPSWTRLLAVAGLAAVLSSCSNEGAGLAGDFQEASKCPPGGCAGLEPDSNQLTLGYGGKTTIYQAAASGDMVEIGGTCYASTYPNNRLEVTLFLQSGSSVALGAGDVIAVRAASTTPACIQGRFNIAINGARMPAGNLYRAHIEIVGADNTGEYRNYGAGKIDVNISR